MSDTRIYAETRCEHGKTRPHPLPVDGEPSEWYGQCTEGVRREITIDYQAAHDVIFELTHDDFTDEQTRRVVDAAAFGEVGDD